jgi:hypothetical protein
MGQEISADVNIFNKELIKTNPSTSHYGSNRHTCKSTEQSQIAYRAFKERSKQGSR